MPKPKLLEPPCLSREIEDSCLFLWSAHIPGTTLPKLADTLTDAAQRFQRMQGSLSSSAAGPPLPEILLAEAESQTQKKKNPPGLDALRLAIFFALSSQEPPAPFSVHLENAKEFLALIWRTSQWARQHLSAPSLTPSGAGGFADAWLAARARQAHKEITNDFYRQHPGEAAIRLRSWAGDDFAGWYVPLLQSLAPASLPLSPSALGPPTPPWFSVLQELIALLHPLVPCFTESLWQQLSPIRPPAPVSLLALSPWPRTTPAETGDAAVIEEMRLLRDLVSALRGLRALHALPAPKPLSLLLSTSSAEEASRWLRHAPLLRKLGHLSDLTIGPGLTVPAGSAQATAGAGRLILPLAEVLDLARERKRLADEISRLRKHFDELTWKLKNREFLKRAPPEIVSQERQRHLELRKQVEQLQDQIRFLAP